MLTSYTTDTISSNDTSSSEVWTCILTPSDGTSTGSVVQVDVVIDSNNEGAEGGVICSAAGAGNDGAGYTMTSCLSEVGVAGEVATDTSSYVWQPGSIFIFDPQ